MRPWTSILASAPLLPRWWLATRLGLCRLSSCRGLRRKAWPCAEIGPPGILLRYPRASLLSSLWWSMTIRLARIYALANIISLRLSANQIFKLSVNPFKLQEPVILKSFSISISLKCNFKLRPSLKSSFSLRYRPIIKPHNPLKSNQLIFSIKLAISRR